MCSDIMEQLEWLSLLAHLSIYIKKYCPLVPGAVSAKQARELTFEFVLFSKDVHFI